jgi:hypothetical protein
MPKLSFPAFFICENAIKNAETVISGVFSWENAKNAICESHDSQSANNIYANYV